MDRRERRQVAGQVVLRRASPRGGDAGPRLVRGLWERVGRQRRRRRPRDRPERLTVGVADDLLGQLGPDGKTLYFVSNRNTTNQVFAQNMADGRAQQLFDDGADVTWPRVSPDGRAILYISFRESASGQLCVRRLPERRRPPVPRATRPRRCRPSGSTQAGSRSSAAARLKATCASSRSMRRGDAHGAPARSTGTSRAPRSRPTGAGSSTSRSSGRCRPWARRSRRTRRPRSRPFRWRRRPRRRP